MRASAPPNTWHELLRELLQEESERDLPACEDGAVQQASQPGAGASGGNEDQHELKIPTRFYVETLRAASDTKQCFWTVCSLVSHQMLTQLDPQRLGMEVIIARCMPPHADGKIYSLRCVAQGTPPWTPSYLQEKNLLLGAESLAGYAVSRGHAVATGAAFHHTEPLPPLGVLDPFGVSLAAFPVARSGNTAGCVLVSSTQDRYFTRARLRLLGDYADLLRLAFRDKDFYPPASLALGLLPGWCEQQKYFSTLGQRVQAVQRQALQEERILDALTAEDMVRQALEAELLQAAGGKGGPRESAKAPPV